ncbi:MAG: GNAT family N-acetyltransferase [Eubacteriales bacterium]|nr:GNAT family N-acetyltransferase [Eubacteriales bacterium]
MKITVRKALERDIPELISMLMQVAKVHHDARPDIFKTGSKKYDEQELRTLLADELTAIFVAADESDTAVGYIFCMLHEYKNHFLMRDCKTLYIDDLCIDNTVRSSGIGRILYSHACAFAKLQGCYNITLNVWAGNDNALKFYEHLGLFEQKRTMEMIL